jgi:hypothetical protein
MVEGDLVADGAIELLASSLRKFDKGNSFEAYGGPRGATAKLLKALCASAHSKIDGNGRVQVTEVPGNASVSSFYFAL